MPILDSYEWEKPEKLEELAKAEYDQRKSEIEGLWKYYLGKHSKPLKPSTSRENVIINLCSKAIDQAVALLFGKEPTFQVSESEDTPEEESLAELFEANGGALWFADLGLAASVAGHAFIKLLPVQGGLRLLNLDAKQVSAFWKGDDIETVVAYRVAWSVGSTEYRQHIVRADIAGRGEVSWYIRDLKWDSRSNKWEETALDPWPYPWPPIVDWKNLPLPGEYYGRSDLKQPDLNDSVNFIASNTQRIIRHHAHPKTVIVGASASQLTATSVDGIWSLPKEASVNNLEMQSDLGSSLAWFNSLRGHFFSQHQAVDIAIMADKVGQLTNFGLRTLYKDALDKLDLKRLLYGHGLEEICSHAFALVGIVQPPPVSVSWPDPLPYNDLEEIQSIQTEMELGIMSKQTASELRGRDWEVEKERMALEGGDLADMILRKFEAGE